VEKFAEMRGKQKAPAKLVLGGASVSGGPITYLTEVDRARRIRLVIILGGFNSS
jgi:hypothetical protein